MINSAHQVNDGLDAKCVNNRKDDVELQPGGCAGRVAELYGQTHDGIFWTRRRIGGDAGEVKVD